MGIVLRRSLDRPGVADHPFLFAGREHAIVGPLMDTLHRAGADAVNGLGLVAHLTDVLRVPARLQQARCRGGDESRKFETVKGVRRRYKREARYGRDERLGFSALIGIVFILATALSFIFWGELGREIEKANDDQETPVSSDKNESGQQS